MEPDLNTMPSPKLQLLTPYALFAGDPTPRLISPSLSEGNSCKPCHPSAAAQALPACPGPIPHLPSPLLLSMSHPLYLLTFAVPLVVLPLSLERIAVRPGKLACSSTRVTHHASVQVVKHKVCSHGVRHSVSTDQTQGEHSSNTAMLVKDGHTLVKPSRPALPATAHLHDRYVKVHKGTAPLCQGNQRYCTSTHTCVSIYIYITNIYTRIYTHKLVGWAASCAYGVQVFIHTHMGWLLWFTHTHGVGPISVWDAPDALVTGDKTRARSGHHASPHASFGTRYAILPGDTTRRLVSPTH